MTHLRSILIYLLTISLFFSTFDSNIYAQAKMIEKSTKTNITFKTQDEFIANFLKKIFRKNKHHPLFSKLNKLSNQQIRKWMLKEKMLKQTLQDFFEIDRWSQILNRYYQIIGRDKYLNREFALNEKSGIIRGDKRKLYKKLNWIPQTRPKDNQNPLGGPVTYDMNGFVNIYLKKKIIKEYSKSSLLNYLSNKKSGRDIKSILSKIQKFNSTSVKKASKKKIISWMALAAELRAFIFPNHTFLNRYSAVGTTGMFSIMPYFKTPKILGPLLVFESCNILCGRNSEIKKAMGRGVSKNIVIKSSTKYAIDDFKQGNYRLSSDHKIVPKMIKDDDKVAKALTTQEISEIYFEQYDLVKGILQKGYMTRYLNYNFLKDKYDITKTFNVYKFKKTNIYKKQKSFYDKYFANNQKNIRNSIMRVEPGLLQEKYELEKYNYIRDHINRENLEKAISNHATFVVHYSAYFDGQQASIYYNKNTTKKQLNDKILKSYYPIKHSKYGRRINKAFIWAINRFYNDKRNWEKVYNNGWGLGLAQAIYQMSRTENKVGKLASKITKKYSNKLDNYNRNKKYSKIASLPKQYQHELLFNIKMISHKIMRNLSVDQLFYSINDFKEKIIPQVEKQTSFQAVIKNYNLLVAQDYILHSKKGFHSFRKKLVQIYKEVPGELRQLRGLAIFEAIDKKEKMPFSEKFISAAKGGYHYIVDGTKTFAYHATDFLGGLYHLQFDALSYPFRNLFSSNEVDFYQASSQWFYDRHIQNPKRSLVGHVYHDDDTWAFLKVWLVGVDIFFTAQLLAGVAGKIIFKVGSQAASLGSAGWGRAVIGITDESAARLLLRKSGEKVTETAVRKLAPTAISRLTKAQIVELVIIQLVKEAGIGVILSLTAELGKVYVGSKEFVWSDFIENSIKFALFAYAIRGTHLGTEILTNKVTSQAFLGSLLTSQLRTASDDITIAMQDMGNDKKVNHMIDSLVNVGFIAWTVSRIASAKNLSHKDLQQRNFLYEKLRLYIKSAKLKISQKYNNAKQEFNRVNKEIIKLIEHCMNNSGSPGGGAPVLVTPEGVTFSGKVTYKSRYQPSSRQKMSKGKDNTSGKSKNAKARPSSKEENNTPKKEENNTSKKEKTSKSKPKKAKVVSKSKIADLEIIIEQVQSGEITLEDAKIAISKLISQVENYKPLYPKTARENRARKILGDNYTKEMLDALELATILPSSKLNPEYGNLRDRILDKGNWSESARNKVKEQGLSEHIKIEFKPLSKMLNNLKEVYNEYLELFNQQRANKQSKTSDINFEITRRNIKISFKQKSSGVGENLTRMKLIERLNELDSNSSDVRKIRKILRKLNERKSEQNGEIQYEISFKLIQTKTANTINYYKITPEKIKIGFRISMSKILAAKNDLGKKVYLDFMRYLHRTVRNHQKEMTTNNENGLYGTLLEFLFTLSHIEYLTGASIPLKGSRSWENKSNIDMMTKDYMIEIGIADKAINKVTTQVDAQGQFADGKQIILFIPRSSASGTSLQNAINKKVIVVRNPLILHYLVKLGVTNKSQ